MHSCKNSVVGNSFNDSSLFWENNNQDKSIPYYDQESATKTQKRESFSNLQLNHENLQSLYSDHCTAKKINRLQLQENNPFQSENVGTSSLCSSQEKVYLQKIDTMKRVISKQEIAINLLEKEIKLKQEENEALRAKQPMNQEKLEETIQNLQSDAKKYQQIIQERTQFIRSIEEELDAFDQVREAQESEIEMKMQIIQQLKKDVCLLTKECTHKNGLIVNLISENKKKCVVCSNRRDISGEIDSIMTNPNQKESPTITNPNQKENPIMTYSNQKVNPTITNPNQQMDPIMTNVLKEKERKIAVLEKKVKDLEESLLKVDYEHEIQLREMKLENQKALEEWNKEIAIQIKGAIVKIESMQKVEFRLNDEILSLKQVLVAKSGECKDLHVKLESLEDIENRYLVYKEKVNQQSMERFELEKMRKRLLEEKVCLEIEIRNRIHSKESTFTQESTTRSGKDRLA